MSAHLILLYVIILIIFNKDNKLWTSLACNFPRPPLLPTSERYYGSYKCYQPDARHISPATEHTEVPTYCLELAASMQLNTKLFISWNRTPLDNWSGIIPRTFSIVLNQNTRWRKWLASPHI
jgi:hypothetical protein